LNVLHQLRSISGTFNRIYQSTPRAYLKARTACLKNFKDKHLNSSVIETAFREDGKLKIHHLLTF
jgi:hypothetical protein